MKEMERRTKRKGGKGGRGKKKLKTFFQRMPLSCSPNLPSKGHLTGSHSHISLPFTQGRNHHNSSCKAFIILHSSPLEPNTRSNLFNPG